MHHVKYLGVFLDEHLSLEIHITQLCNSLARYFSIFYNIRNMVPVKLKKQLYYSFVYSRIAYGIEVYGSCNSTLLTKIQVMQNKLLKILYNRERRYPTNILHHEVKVLLVKDIHEVLLLKFIHTVLNGKPVKRFEHYFRKRNQTHNYATRHADSIAKDKCKTRYGKRKVHYLCATKWNDLENSIKNFEYSAFKKTITEQKINNYRA